MKQTYSFSFFQSLYSGVDQQGQAIGMQNINDIQISRLNNRRMTSWKLLVRYCITLKLLRRLMSSVFSLHFVGRLLDQSLDSLFRRGSQTSKVKCASKVVSNAHPHLLEICLQALVATCPLFPGGRRLSDCFFAEGDTRTYYFGCACQAIAQGRPSTCLGEPRVAS